MIAAQVAQVAAALYAVETLSLQTRGEAQPLAPEAFVPGAVRILQEAQRAEGMGWAQYLELDQGPAGGGAFPALAQEDEEPSARGVVGEIGDAGDVGDVGSNAPGVPGSPEQ